MSDNPLHLIANKKYKLIKEFIDYDGKAHPVGETWTFVRTDFAPHDDGLSISAFGKDESDHKGFRLQWVEEQQKDIIENFKEYVEPCEIIAGGRAPE